jgi:hypothetical protein
MTHSSVLVLTRQYLKIQAVLSGVGVAPVSGQSLWMREIIGMSNQQLPLK